MDGKRDPARLGFGCVRLGSISGGGSMRRDVRLIHEAIDAGVTIFDTADTYGNGTSERVLGRALRGRRSDVEIATKVGYLFDDRPMVNQRVKRIAYPAVLRARRRRATAVPHTGLQREEQNFSPEYLRAAVDASLRRLGTDYLDVCQLHAPATVLPEAVEELNRLVDTGKMRRFGVGAERVSAARDWLSSVDSLGVLQVPFGLLDPAAAEGLFGLAADHSASIWARGVFGGGMFATSPHFPAKPVSDPKSELVDQLQTLASQRGVSLFQLSLDYVRSFGVVSTVLVGINSPEHLAQNLAMWAAPRIDTAVLQEAEGLVASWYERNRAE
jgi:aryl-alcohol dehydrogenase-like predicted oxidoreductase